MTLQLSITRRVTGETPKCFLNALEKCLRLEKPARRATVLIGNPSPCSKSRQARSMRIRRTMLIGSINGVGVD
jgi:hypothetical protein